MTNSEPTLKCVVAWSDRRNLCSLVADAIRENGMDDILQLGDETLAVYGYAEPSAVRDWLADVVEESESALVVEFERWSSFGKLDSGWLMRRGH